MIRKTISLCNEHGETVLELLTRQGYSLSCCGGRGTCRRCQIRFIKAATLPSTADRRFFKPEQLRQGYRLACCSRPQGAFEIEIHFIEETGTNVIVEEWNQESKRRNIVHKISSEGYIAIDLGTTTVAMQLIDVDTMQAVTTYRALNPQRSYGKDVLSRITAANEGKDGDLRECIQKEVQKGIEELVSVGEGRKIRVQQIVISANTTMMHLFMGYDTSTLGTYPFKPFCLDFVYDAKIFQKELCFLPGISTFVGGDIVSGIYYLELHKRKEVSLFIDLGTNGEIVLGNREKLLVTATAAGPAFEGGPLSTIHGSDMISVIADMLEEGIADAKGSMLDCYFEKGYPVQSVLVTQKDIRDLQMAKAAIYAGILLLTEKYQITLEEIGQVFLAGGFGHYLNVEKAIRIGLFPKELQKKVISVGNTSLAGASRFLKNMGGTKNEAEKELREIIRIAEEINLAKLPTFEETYLAALNFPSVN